MSIGCLGWHDIDIDIHSQYAQRFLDIADLDVILHCSY